MRASLLQLLLLPLSVAAAERPSFSSTGCGDSKGCLYKPEHCVLNFDCVYAFSYAYDVEHERLIMEIFALLPLTSGQSGGWAAVGFSADDLMVCERSSFWRAYSRRFAGRRHRDAMLIF